MKSAYASSLDIYRARAFRLIVVMIPLVAIVAGSVYTSLHAFGLYPEVNPVSLAIFDTTCLIHVVVGAFLYSNCLDENGLLKKRKERLGKIFIAVVEFVQWNFISYMIPSKDFWAYAVFFVLLTVFFLDHKYLSVVIAEIFISTILSWTFDPDCLLPEKDELFIPNIVLRIVLLTLSFATIWLSAYWVEKHLVRELEKIADYDTLTLLRNRRSLDRQIDGVLNKAEEENKSITIFMIDLDDFKVINDTYGHSCGDEVLKAIGRIVHNDVGDNGHAYRYGGEEILCVMKSSESKSLEIAEKIRRDIENHTVEYGKNRIRLTATIGAAVYKGNKITSDEFIKRADENLYFGKKNGKNQVVIGARN